MSIGVAMVDDGGGGMALQFGLKPVMGFVQIHLVWGLGSIIHEI